MTKHTPVTEIELKAKNTAPRVTEQELEANIKSYCFFSAYEGLRGAMDHPDTEQFRERHGRHLSLMTFCVITLQNGFTVTGESACVSAENFDPEIGQRIAYENAKQKIWLLMGYALRERLHQDEALLAGMAFMPGQDMDTYIGTKPVNAQPMTRGAYNELRGWLLPDGENPDDEGYLVEYTDKVTENVDGFAGYVSWSPKDTFEKAYRRVA